MKLPKTRTRVLLLIAIAATLGVFAGVGSYTFYYAEGLSVFPNDPKPCVNCHIIASPSRS